MKNSLALIICILSFVAIGQRSIVLYDKTDQVPIEYAKSFTKDNQFVGVSNSLGQITLSDAGYPYEIKCVGYLPATLSAYQDTLFLVQKYQMMDELSVKPVNCMDLYTAILDKSSEKIDKNNSVRYGVFFESLLMIDTKYHDTIRMEAICDLAIQKSVAKKKISYGLFCENGKRSFTFRGTGNGALADDSDDTTLFGKLLGVMPTFDKSLAYDLSKTKNYELKFEENQIRREPGVERSKLRFESADKRTNNVDVEYRDSVLYSWKYQEFHAKEYDGSGIFVNFKVDNRLCEFDETPYELETVISNHLIQMGFNGVLYDIYLVKGFISDPDRKFELKQSVKMVEDYLETLQHSPGMTPFYNFDLKN